jgi:D-3-phosphoglycerate dehydrogenase
VEIVILDDYQNAARGLRCFRRLDGHHVRVYSDSTKDREALASRLRGAHAVVLIRERTRIDDELLAQVPDLRIISQTGRVAGHVDLAACTRRGVMVAEGAGSPVAPAELTWALVLGAMRRVPLEAARLREGRWQTTVGRALRGRTLGIFGYGRIGSLVAEYGRAFGMHVVAWGRHGSRSRAREAGVALAESRAALFEEADVLSVHVRLTPETRAMITRADLARMKKDALFVNTSRAELVAPGALVAALRAGRPGFAAVDVYEEEPVLNAAHPLLAMENALCTPHLGYVEEDAYELMFGAAFENILELAAGRGASLANPEVLDVMAEEEGGAA